MCTKTGLKEQKHEAGEGVQKAQLLIPNLCIINSYHLKSKRKKKFYSIVNRAQLFVSLPSVSHSRRY